MQTDGAQGIEAAKLEALAPPPSAVEAPCRYHAECRGCNLQALPYKAQLDAKRQRLLHDLRHSVGLGDAADSILEGEVQPSSQELRCAATAA